MCGRAIYSPFAYIQSAFLYLAFFLVRYGRLARSCLNKIRRGTCCLLAVAKSYLRYLYGTDEHLLRLFKGAIEAVIVLL